MTISGIMLSSAFIKELKTSGTMNLPYGSEVVETVTVTEETKTFKVLDSRNIWKETCLETWNTKVFVEVTANRRKVVKDFDADSFMKTDSGFALYKGSTALGIVLPFFQAREFESWVEGNTLYINKEALDRVIASVHAHIPVYVSASSTTRFSSSDKKKKKEA